jgi:hypothetical protein
MLAPGDGRGAQSSLDDTAGTKRFAASRPAPAAEPVRTAPKCHRSDLHRKAGHADATDMRLRRAHARARRPPGQKL